MDLDAAERIAINAVRAAFAELRAAGGDVAVTQQPVELPETDMARRLGVEPELLRSHRRSGSAHNSLYRSVGRTVLWLVAATEEWAAIKLRR